MLRQSLLYQMRDPMVDVSVFFETGDMVDMIVLHDEFEIDALDIG